MAVAVIVVLMPRIVCTDSKKLKAGEIILNSASDGRGIIFIGGTRSENLAAANGNRSSTKKEKRLYQATHLLDQLLTGYDRRLRPGFRGQLGRCLTTRDLMSVVESVC